MILSGCSMTRFLNDGSKEEHVVFISLPASLMQKFCVLKPAGDTVGDLADAYVDNTLCGKKYEAQVEEQKQYIENVKNNSPKKQEVKSVEEKNERARPVKR